jgi:hypothetical protein
LGESFSTPSVGHSSIPTSSAPTSSAPTSSAPSTDNLTAPTRSWGQKRVRSRGEGTITTSIAPSRGEKTTRGTGATTRYTRKKASTSLATRSKVGGRLRAHPTQTNPNTRGKVMVDLTRNPYGLHKVPRGGHACSWGPPRAAGGITFRVTPSDFDINKAKVTSSDIPPPVGKKDK